MIHMRNSLHHKLMRTHGALHKAVMAKAREIELTSGQPKILEFLMEQNGVEQNVIAQNCGIENATAGNVLGRMEESGLIERRRRDGNRRSLYIYLTERGRAAAVQMEHIFEAADRRATRGLSDEEVSTLFRLLDVVYANITIKGSD